MFVPRNGWQAEPSLPSGTNKNTSVRHGSSDVVFQEPQLEEVLDHDEVLKQEKWQIELQVCGKKGGIRSGRSRGYAYDCSGEEHIPRYMPLGAHGLGDQLESHILFHERNGSLLPRNYTIASPNSLRNSRISPLPPSPRMPSPGSCWPVTEPRSEAPIASGLRMTSLRIGNTADITLPPTPSESCRSASGNETLYEVTENLFRNPMPNDSVEAVSPMTMGHEQLDAKGAGKVGEERKYNETDSKILLFPRFESNQSNSAIDFDSPRDSLTSDTESDNEEEWFTLRYIPEFLREQWLSGSALEMPTMEARAMAIVREVLVDQIMTAFPTFNSRWATDFISNTGSADNRSNSTTESKSMRNSGSNSSSSNNGRKRSWDNEEDAPADGNGGPPDASRLYPGPLQDLQLSLKLACPFRKHDPETYNLQSYRVCATKPWDSISRLKQHLKLVHKAPIYCPRCKQVFETSEALESHLVPVEEPSRACKCQDVPKPAGMTPVMEEKLKGRWKGSTPQALWGKIYQLLFPNEAVPSPDFDPVVDISTPPGPVSPTTNLERPSRRDFLRLVRARVYSEIDTDIRSLSERVKSKLTDIVEDCYAELELGYPNSQEVRQSTSPFARANRHRIVNGALPNATRQDTNWDSGKYSGMQLDVEPNGNGAQTMRLTPPDLPYTVDPLVQTPSADSNSFNCYCKGPCNCFAPTSSGTVVQDMDFEDAGLYMAEYEALWSGGPTNMNMFDNFVNDF